MEGFLVYWALTTLVGTIWLLIGHLDNQDHISIGDILGFFLISGMFAWAFVIMWLLDAARIKVKRNEKTQKQSAGEINGGDGK
jgi:hypothetical protein